MAQLGKLLTGSCWEGFGKRYFPTAWGELKAE